MDRDQAGALSPAIDPRGFGAQSAPCKPSLRTQSSEDTVNRLHRFGLVVGALARLVLPGDQHLSIAATLGIGLVGSVVGGVVANALGTGDIFELNILGSIVAVLSAAALILVVERSTASRGTARH